MEPAAQPSTGRAVEEVDPLLVMTQQEVNRPEPEQPEARGDAEGTQAPVPGQQQAPVLPVPQGAPEPPPQGNQGIQEIMVSSLAKLTDIVANIAGGNSNKSNSDKSDKSEQESKAGNGPLHFTPQGKYVHEVQFLPWAVDKITMLENMPEDLKKKVAKGEFFDVTKIFKNKFLSDKLKGKDANTTRFELTDKSGKLMITTPNSTVEVKGKGEYFELLYIFGGYYLQMYPHKTLSFLNYLHFLATVGAQFNLMGFMELDAKI